jgi:hypothetical protein
MELPSDVLSIVSAYAKPLFRYRREYNEAMFALGITEWPGVKNLLYTGKSDEVIASLTAYANAMSELKQAEKSVWDVNPFTFPDIGERWNEIKRIRKLIRENNRLRYKYYRELCVFMVGEEKVYWEKEMQESDTESEEESEESESEETDEYVDDYVNFEEPVLTDFQALLDEM